LALACSAYSQNGKFKLSRNEQYENSFYSSHFGNLFRQPASVRKANRLQADELTAAAWVNIKPVRSPAVSAVVLSIALSGFTQSSNTEKHSTVELFAAVEAGNLEAVRELLSAGADPNTVDHEGHRVLTTAAEKGNQQIVDALLTAGAEVNAKDVWHIAALRQAVEFWNLDVVKSLIAHGADVNARDSFGKTALFNAAH